MKRTTRHLLSLLVAMALIFYAVPVLAADDDPAPDRTDDAMVLGLTSYSALAPGDVEVDLSTLGSGEIVTVTVVSDNSVTVVSNGSANLDTSFDPTANGLILRGQVGNTASVKVVGDASFTPVVNVTLDGATIPSGGNNAPLEVTGGANVSLTLNGTNTLPSGGDAAGLRVAADSELSIGTSSSGSLDARANGAGAGIGGNKNEASGKITITGGSINAISGYDVAAATGAGIGGGGGGANGTGGANGEIEILGGIIRAYSLSVGAGKGFGAGIGSGGSEFGAAGATTGDITIDGATVTAISANADGSNYGEGYGFGAGIGGGCSGSASTGTGSSVGTITITDSDVTACSAANRVGYGAGVGGGGVDGGTAGAGGVIEITGSTVTAACSNGAGTGYGAGIGGGGIGGTRNLGGGSSGDITISDSTVTAYSSKNGSSYGSGIGGGLAGSGETISISDSTVRASGSLEASGYGSGIGGGSKSSNSGGDPGGAGGEITISGSTVAAFSGMTSSGGGGIGASNAAAIGSNDKVVITGGSVNSKDSPEYITRIRPNPVDANDNNIYLLTATLTGQPNAEVSSISGLGTFDPGTVTSDGGAKIYLWLPDGDYDKMSATVGSVRLESDRNASVDTDNESTITLTAVQTGTAPTITTTSLPDAVAGTAYSETLAASGDAAITWSVTGDSLPAGLTLDAASGEIAGIPTAEGTANFTVEATNSAGSDTQALSIEVYPAGTVLSQLTLVAGTGGTITTGASGDYASGAVVAIGAAPDSGYSFSGWTSSGGGSFADPAGADTTFTMPGNDTTVTAGFTADGSEPGGNPGGGGGSGSSGGGGGRDSSSPAAASNIWLEPAPAKTLAASGGLTYNRTKSTNIFGVRKAAWPNLAGNPYRHDTLEDGVVQVRLTIAAPEKMNRDVYVSGWLKGAAVANRKSFFGKHFTNKVQIIQMDESDPWGQVVEIAAKVDLTGMDTDKLYIYSYNAKTNTYVRITTTGENGRVYWIDNNGYLHIYTEYAGTIVISEGPLQKK